jgi:single-strand DNA-binding protein
MSRLETFINGYLGKDAEVKTFESGRKVINFNVAHTEKKRNAQNEMVETTVWVGCAWWIKEGAEDKVSRFLTKGTQVNLWGYPSAEAYASSDEQGNTIPRAQLRIRVDRLDFVGKPKEGQGDYSAPAPTPQATAQPQNASSLLQNGANVAQDDDLPF